MSVLDDLTDILHIQSPLLYLFEGELIRISRTIAEVRYVRFLTGFGELYGLYSHSRGPVVHLASLKKLDQAQLKVALSRRCVETENEYSLSVLGAWFAVQNLDISPRHLIQSMADTLSENESTVCVVVKGAQVTYDFEDMSKNTHAFFLMEGKIFKMDIKIIRRESPFQLDCDFTKSFSSGGYVASELDEIRSNKRGYHEYGTEMVDMSGKSKAETITSNSEHSFDPSVDGLPESKIESENLHCNDMLGETKEDSDAEESAPDSLSKKHDLIPEESNIAETLKRGENEEVSLSQNGPNEKDVKTVFLPNLVKMSVLDDLTDILHIQSPLLYLFEGELIRISRTIAEVRYERFLTVFGELYGLYSHSRGPVVHLASLKKLDQAQLKVALASRRVETENEYSLSVLGAWFAVQNLDISPRHLIQSMADTLSENESTVCVVVKGAQVIYDFEDMSKNTHAFFLMDGKIFKMDIKIIRRESPFQLDCDFTKSFSSGGYVESKNESENLHCNDMLGETKEDIDAEESAPDSLSTKDDLIPEKSKVSSAQSGPNDEVWVNIVCEKSFDSWAVVETDSTTKRNARAETFQQPNENASLENGEINSTDAKVGSAIGLKNEAGLVSDVLPGNNERTDMESQDMNHLPVAVGNSIKDDKIENATKCHYERESAHANDDNGGNENESSYNTHL
ncbi:uncharacterized protein LOC114531539 [Dendronephthya gigantea]|uniref:uncharacterized protein LOC114531539 n=1 Tax=Dendronephthya gigantea TaxID=151771 RepID=UPI001069B23D|nr:uncharacterized protein LOC114531539 [Dendronephthya gigantea]